MILQKEIKTQIFVQDLQNIVQNFLNRKTRSITSSNHEFSSPNECRKNECFTSSFYCFKSQSESLEENVNFLMLLVCLMRNLHDIALKLCHFLNLIVTI
jgi:hypothetical protein